MPIRLLLADQNQLFLNRVMTGFSKRTDVQVVGSCFSGEVLMKMALAERPDAILSEVVLKERDGLSVLKELHTLIPNLSFIVCTVFSNDMSARRACQYGAAGFLSKPVRMDRVYEAVVDSVRSQGEMVLAEEWEKEASPDQMDRRISLLLSEMNISGGREGCHMLHAAVREAAMNPLLLTSMSKLLYPAVARIFDSTPTRVERNIRSAIADARGRNIAAFGGRKLTNREVVTNLLREVTEDADK